MPRFRLGVALLVPPPLDREVDTLRRAVGDRSLGRIPAHCTLVPPVNVREERLGEALAVLRDAAAATRPFSLTAGAVASFLPDAPVLYLPVDGEAREAVVALRDRVFVEPLARPLTWPFVPHLTIGDELRRERIEAAIDALSAYRLEVPIDRVHLLREGPGREWAPIADAAFARPAVVSRGGLEVELSVSAEPDPEARAFEGDAWLAQRAAEIGPDARDREPFAVTARRDGRVVGLAEGWTQEGVAHLRNLIVAADHRGEGVGARLMAAFESLAAERDCPRLAVRTLADGRARGFYERLGWVEECRFSPWVFGRDTVQLRRDL